MALLSTIAVILVAWFAAGVATAALYAVLRTRHVRRNLPPAPVRATASPAASRRR
ncbi:hypothetical protein J7F03_27630 [Streptomyces sp. ISL-43]|uniref:hypothetical protein n=1 Tax=Streptomyces sp. ISL-43 TaxID=2819183 RepID=UPI001BEBEA33|nr:hypothetical protein [Streptomyces sp. ISL-43]MBT2450776.1 hypothetical protein [Streptomyces sp. ISL-43]